MVSLRSPLEGEGTMAKNIAVCYQDLILLISARHKNERSFS